MCVAMLLCSKKLLGLIPFLYGLHVFPMHCGELHFPPILENISASLIGDTELS